MRRARHLSPAVVSLVALLLVALPGTARAAEPVVITGTVVHDGTPVTGVEVVVSVTGSDIIAAATTDEHGVFGVEVEAGAGDTVRVYATGQTSRSEPDGQGCVRTETRVGSLETPLVEVPPAPLVVSLDQVITGEVCTATSKPRVTPPATDVRGPRQAGGGGSGLLLVLGVLALLGSGSIALARRRG